MLWLQSMDVSNRNLLLYILPRSVHGERQLIVNTLSVTQPCTYVPRLFVGRMVVWATAEVEVHMGVFLINDVAQWAIRSPVNIHGWNMAVCLHGELNVWWTLFSQDKKPPPLAHETRSHICQPCNETSRRLMGCLTQHFPQILHVEVPVL